MGSNIILFLFKKNKNKCITLQFYYYFTTCEGSHSLRTIILQDTVFHFKLCVASAF